MDAITRALTGEQKKKLAQAVKGLDPISQLLAGQDGRNEQLAQMPAGPDMQHFERTLDPMSDLLAQATGSPLAGQAANSIYRAGKGALHDTFVKPAQFAKAMTVDPLIDGGTALGEGLAQGNATKAAGGAAYAGLGIVPFSKAGMAAMGSIPKLMSWGIGQGVSGEAVFGDHPEDPVMAGFKATGETLAPRPAHAAEFNNNPPMPERNPRRLPPQGQSDQPQQSAQPVQSGGGLMDGISKAMGWVGDQFAGGEAPDYDPMTFDQYRKENLPPPPSMTDYVTEQAGNARTEYLRQKPGWSRGAARSAKAAAALAEKQYPSFIADYEQRKTGLQDDYDDYVAGQKSAYDKHYSKSFKERNPFIHAGLMGAAYVAPALMTRGGFGTINRATSNKTKSLIDARGGGGAPANEAIAADVLRRQTISDPLQKAAVFAHSAALPTELGIAEDLWDAHSLPEGTPAQEMASSRLTPEGLKTNAMERLPGGVLSAAAGALMPKTPSRMGEARAHLQYYKDPKQFDAVTDQLRQRRASHSAEGAVSPDRQAFYEAQAKSRYRGRPEPEAPQGPEDTPSTPHAEPGTPAPTPSTSPGASGQRGSSQAGSVSGSGRSSGASGREYTDMDRTNIRDIITQDPALGQRLGDMADITRAGQTNGMAKRYANNANDFVGGDPLRMTGQKPTPGVNSRTKETLSFLQANMKGGNPISWEELIGKIPKTPQYLAVPGAVGLGAAMQDQNDPILQALYAQYLAAMGTQGGF